MTEEGLKPCPFCGGKAELREDLDYHTGKPTGMWWAICPACDLIRGQGFCVPREEAIAAWNTRTMHSASPTPASVTEDEIERVAKIVEPRLWGSPWNYPDGVEHDDELERRRNIARAKARAALKGDNNG